MEFLPRALDFRLQPGAAFVAVLDQGGDALPKTLQEDRLLLQKVEATRVQMETF